MTQFTKQQVAEIADSMDDYQRHGLISAAPCKGGAYWTPYRIGNTALSRGGVLTELGLAVRAHLERQQ